MKQVNIIIVSCSYSIFCKHVVVWKLEIFPLYHVILILSNIFLVCSLQEILIPWALSSAQWEESEAGKRIKGNKMDFSAAAGSFRWGQKIFLEYWLENSPISWMCFTEMHVETLSPLQPNKRCIFSWFLNYSFVNQHVVNKGKCFKASGNGIKSIRGSWGDHLGPFLFRGHWLIQGPQEESGAKFRPFPGRIWPTLTPPPPANLVNFFLVPSGLYRCPTYSTTYFMFGSHLLWSFKAL